MISVRHPCALVACRRVLACLVIALVGAGCVYSVSPRETTEFAEVTVLDQVAGRYRNRGWDGPEPTDVFLSALIWPNETGLDHRAIEVVEVIADGNDALVVRAYRHDRAMAKEGRFVAGQDFRLSNGRLQILREAAATSQAIDDPLVGPRVETADFGIDSGGHGKYRRSFKGAGLVYLVLPVVISDAQEVRFERLKD